MKIEEVRTSFTVYIIASELERLNGLSDSLSMAGYMLASFNELTSAFSEFYSNPPHFLIFDLEEKAFDLKKALQQVVAQLPESHILLVTPVGARDKAVPLLEHGVYDLILTPVISPVELVRALDRAAERDYFMYVNERLMQAADEAAAAATEAAHSAEIPPPIPASEPTPLRPEAAVPLSENLHSAFARELFAQGNLDDCIRVFLRSYSKVLGGTPAVFFRYIANRRVLLAAIGENSEGMDLGGLGMDLNETSPGFRSQQLQEPLRVAPFVEMVKEVFQVPDFLARPMNALGEIQGVACFLSPAPAQGALDILQEWLVLLEKAASLVEAEKRLHVVTVKDGATDLLNRQNFIAKINEEIARSRRTQLPVCLALIAIDQYGQLTSDYGQEETQVVLRTAARILEKHSRVNDIFGRTGVDEFGLLLPHTAKQNGLVKAERLRLIIESADFSKVLKGFPRMTISLGVSEYPSLVRDAEELLASADEALYQVRSVSNKTCVAKAPDGFEPDFLLQEKGP